MFDWDRDNVIVTGSSDGVVRVSTCTHMLLWQTSLICMEVLQAHKESVVKLVQVSYYSA